MNYAEINNLAEYGQPFSPYDYGKYDQEFIPDFGKVVIEMPQIEVMMHGYGRNITPEAFPVAKKFLNQKLSLAPGTYDFKELVRQRFASEHDRWIQTNLYGWGRYGITAGSISALDAAYIHGTVSLALMAGTRFFYSPPYRRIEAEIGAGNDNWDFESLTIPRVLNAAVAAIFGPDHYNLTAPIQIIFTGPGRRVSVSKLTGPQ